MCFEPSTTSSAGISRHTNIEYYWAPFNTNVKLYLLFCSLFYYAVRIQTVQNWNGGTDERGTGKDLEGSLIKILMWLPAQRTDGNHNNAHIGLPIDPTEIRTSHLPNVSIECHQYTNPFCTITSVSSEMMRDNVGSCLCYLATSIHVLYF
jgi:hypothetical protein